MSKKIKGKCSHCGKPISYYFKKGRVDHFCDKYCYGKSLKGMPSNKKGCKLSKTTKKKISKRLRKFFENGGTVWNKGKRLVKVRKDTKYYRKNKEYYLRELEQNAIRRKVKGYDDTPKRKEASKKNRMYKQEITGAGQKAKRWTIKEITYLKTNYMKKDILKMAFDLDRSWSSISHKLSRLKLRKNHKWM